MGLVADVRSDGLDTAPTPAMYFPFQQTPFGNMRILVRTAGDPLVTAAAIRQAIWAVDSDLVLDDMGTLASAVEETLAPNRYGARLLGAFAVLALVLSAVGLYGVMSYAVAQRTREIGLRKALGAGKVDILIDVVARGLVLWTMGAVLGVGLALAGGSLMASALYGVSARDPWTMGFVVVVMGVVAASAALVPANRAARIQPAVALKEN